MAVFLATLEGRPRRDRVNEFALRFVDIVLAETVRGICKSVTVLQSVGYELVTILGLMRCASAMMPTVVDGGTTTVDDTDKIEKSGSIYHYIEYEKHQLSRPSKRAVKKRLLRGAAVPPREEICDSGGGKDDEGPVDPSKGVAIVVWDLPSGLEEDEEINIRLVVKGFCSYTHTNFLKKVEDYFKLQERK